MEGSYEINGIDDEIIKKIGKTYLARYFGVALDADFRKLMLEDLRKRGVPSGVEVAGCESVRYGDMKEGMTGYLHGLCEKYTKGGRAAFGIQYPLSIDADVNELYFFVKGAMEDEVLSRIEGGTTYLGGVLILGYLMDERFYEAYKDEISKFQEKANAKKAFDDYVKAYLDGEYDEKRACSDYGECMRGAEQLILKITGKKSIRDVTLGELNGIKNAMENERDKAKRVFSSRDVSEKNGELVKGQEL